MSLLLGAFPSSTALIGAARTLRQRGVEVADIFTPYAVEGLTEFLPAPDRGVRASMLLTGFIVGGLSYLLEWWTAVIAFPFNSGGRPPHSWPVFFLFPFEFGVLAAAVAGFTCFLIKTGLPRYHDAIFDADLAQQPGSFVLALKAPSEPSVRNELFVLLTELGAHTVDEVAA